MIFKYSDRQIFRGGVKRTHSRSATHRWGEFFRFVCQLCLPHPQVSLSCISNHHLRWYGPEFDLDVPAVAPSTALSGTFGPCHKNLTFCWFIRFVVIWSTCRQLESWLCGDLWWHCTRATAGQCFAPDVKGAKNQHQVCSIDPCAGGRGGPFN